MGNKDFGIDLNVINLITNQIATVFKSGVKLSIVVGGEIYSEEFLPLH